MLRSDSATTRTRALGVGLAAAIGAAAATLVLLGNPGNMGLCGACFLRDLAGALGFSDEKGPAIFRPEAAGIVLGATTLALVRGRFVARSGSYAALRFALGVGMAVGALMFLGCPFRLLQRLGGGDLGAWLALPGFVAGVLVATVFERRGYAIGKTAPAPGAVGAVGPVAFLLLLGAFLYGALEGPGPGDGGGPAHAPWGWALAIALTAGVALSATGFCAVSAVRAIRGPRRTMLAAALALILGYAATAVLGGSFKASFEGQPAAHGDVLWSAFGLFAVGLCSALAGGCPVRQLVLCGEGNGDATTTVVGLIVGGALAHNFGLASSAATGGNTGGATAAGKAAVLAVSILALAVAWTVTDAHARQRATASSSS